LKTAFYIKEIRQLGTAKRELPDPDVWATENGFQNTRPATAHLSSKGFE